MRHWFDSKLTLINEKLKLESEVKRLGNLCADRYNEIRYRDEVIQNNKEVFELEKSQILQLLKRKDNEIIHLKDLIQAKDMIIVKLEGKL